MRTRWVGPLAQSMERGKENENNDKEGKGAAMLDPGRLGEVLTVRQEDGIQPVGIRLMPRQVQRRKVPTAAAAHDRHHQGGAILADRRAGGHSQLRLVDACAQFFPTSVAEWPLGKAARKPQPSRTQKNNLTDLPP